MADKTEERLALEARAKELALDVPHNIGDAKLAKRIEAAEAKAQKGGTTPPAGSATPPVTNPPEVTKAPKGAAITVVGPKAGRWRAGRHFTKEPVVIALDDLGKGELDALKADPKLSVKE